MKPKYLRMLQRMAEDPRRQACTWSVYMLRCRDGTYYTGIAKDVQERLRKHQAGKGAAYTRTRLPVELLYEENGLTRSEALVWEARIKAMPRAKKGRLARKKVYFPAPIRLRLYYLSPPIQNINSFAKLSVADRSPP